MLKCYSIFGALTHKWWVYYRINGFKLTGTGILRQNKDYFETLDIKFVTDNELFWKTVAPLFSDKSKESNKITLSENEKLIMNDQKCNEVFNNYFNGIVKELNIPIDQNLLNDTSIFDNPIVYISYLIILLSYYYSNCTQV